MVGQDRKQALKIALDRAFELNDDRATLDAGLKADKRRPIKNDSGEVRVRPRACFYGLGGSPRSAPPKAQPRKRVSRGAI